MKRVYLFSKSLTEGNSKMKDLLGGKGANLAEMSNIGINVPSGFTISTTACLEYYKHGKISDSLKEEVNAYVKKVEEIMGRKFGDVSEMPLLFSVRSGAKFSMPGMMDTILNLGITKDNFKAIEKHTNERFALDVYRRFLAMYGNVVLGIKHHKFDEVLCDVKLQECVKQDCELSVKGLKKVADDFEDTISKNVNFKDFNDPYFQLFSAIESVFKSWNNPRAIAYREMNNIDHNIGTAVNIQAMVFGNLNDISGTGVVFSRNPSNGKKEVYGEYMINAQGEDVVAGIRTPSVICSKSNKDAMSVKWPEIYNELIENINQLESHYNDMQDIEFTVENGKLYILQTRNGKRTAHATVKILHDLVQEGKLSKQDAILKLNVPTIEHLLHPNIDYSKNTTAEIATGLPASPGAVSGIVAFSVEDVKRFAALGKKCILVREETSPDDIVGMNLSEGILTSCGGMTSHAAVVARGMGKTCIVGCSSLKFTSQDKATLNSHHITKDTIITIDGSNGRVFLGDIDKISGNFCSEFQTILDWCDEISDMQVLTNAENVKDISAALKFKARGVGLCRTEHMIFEKSRLNNFRSIVLAEEDSAVFAREVDKFLNFQKEDFKEIFNLLQGKEISIRLIDPPLHEFFNCSDDELKELSKISNVSIDVVRDKVLGLHEQNPMLGHRGVRLGITYPELYKAQVEAIFRACNELKFTQKVNIMIPLVCFKEEFEAMEEIIKDARNEVGELKNIDLKIGVMIETPRSCLIAKELSQNVDFFSFGTNDLTQTTLGISRDDSGKFMPDYIKLKILKQDPFVEVDDGVLEMMKFALKDVKIKSGVCGEHGGEFNSIEKFNQIGINYVSCSPYRVPVARFACAFSKLNKKSL